jgi:D-xylose transport system substrate-binding protein
LRPVTTALAVTAIATSAALAVAACASSTLSPSQIPQLTSQSFTMNFSAMSRLKVLAAHGSGKVGVILPGTVSSTRYIEFDGPYLKKALTDAGLTSSQFTIQNAQGSDAGEYNDARAAISKGAKVLIMDPIDRATGVKIESYAQQQGVPVVDYDQITLGGSRQYYVSFDSVKVGTLLGEGLISCIKGWGVKNPKVIMMTGDPTDNTATLFADGYDAALAPLFANKIYSDVANPAGTWTPTVALSEFRAAYTKNPGANAALVPSDENGAPIIRYLRAKGVKPATFPVTGQDATLTGIRNIVAGYQCGTVYKPIYLEAEAATALAMYLRAGVKPPAALINGSVQDVDENNARVPSILLTPQWVTASTVDSTVVKDGFVQAAQICAGSFSAACGRYGISS